MRPDENVQGTVQSKGDGESNLTLISYRNETKTVRKYVTRRDDSLFIYEVSSKYHPLVVVRVLVL